MFLLYKIKKKSQRGNQKHPIICEYPHPKRYSCVLLEHIMIKSVRIRYHCDRIIFNCEKKNLSSINSLSLDKNNRVLFRLEDHITN